MKSIFVSLLIMVFATSLSAFSVTEKQLSVGMEDYLSHYLSGSGRAIASDNTNTVLVWSAPDMGMSYDLVVLSSGAKGVRRFVLPLSDDQINPSVVLHDNVLYLVCSTGYRYDFQVILYLSRTLGESWEGPYFVSDGWDAFYPVVGVCSDSVYVAWQDYRSGISEVYYDSSPINGISFGDDQLLSGGGECSYVSVATSKTDLVITWFEDTAVVDDIWYIRHSWGFASQSMSVPSGNEKHYLSACFLGETLCLAYVEKDQYYDILRLVPESSFYMESWYSPKIVYDLQIDSKDSSLVYIWRDHEGIQGVFTQDNGYNYTSETCLVDRPGGVGDYVHANLNKNALLLAYGDYLERGANHVFGALVRQ